MRPKGARRFALLAVVILVFLAGCSEETLQLLQPNVEERPNITIAYDPGQGTNPYLTSSLITHQLSGLLYTGLVVNDSEKKSQNLLAHMITADEQNIIYTVRLRNDMTFEDGSEITVQDVASSLTAAKNSEYYGTLLQNMLSVVAVGDEVVIELETADAFFYRLLTMPILKSSEVGQKNPMSSGEYRREADTLILRDEASESVTQTIELVDMTESQSVAEGLNIGRISVLDTTYLSSFLPYSDLSLVSYPTDNLLFLGFNPDSQLFSEPLQRRAIASIVPRDEIVADVYDENAFGTLCPLHPVSGYCDCTVDYTPLDQNEVTILFNRESAGRTAVTNEIKIAFAEYGISVNELIAEDHEQFEELFEQGDYDIYLAKVLLPPNLDFSFFLDEEVISQHLMLEYQNMKSTGETERFCDAFSFEMPVVPILFEPGTLYHVDWISGLSPRDNNPYFNISEVIYD